MAKSKDESLKAKEEEKERLQKSEREAVEQMEDLLEKYQTEYEQRRKLYNNLQEVKGSAK